MLNIPVISTVLYIQVCFYYSHYRTYKAPAIFLSKAPVLRCFGGRRRYFKRLLEERVQITANIVPILKKIYSLFW